MNLLSPEAQAKILSQLGNPNEIEASPAGAILMGMYVLEYVGFPKYVDELLGEDIRPLNKLNKRKYVKLDYCRNKLDELLKSYPNTRKFLPPMPSFSIEEGRNIHELVVGLCHSECRRKVRWDIRIAH